MTRVGRPPLVGRLPHPHNHRRLQVSDELSWAKNLRISILHLFCGELFCDRCESRRRRRRQGKESEEATWPVSDWKSHPTSGEARKGRGVRLRPRPKLHHLPTSALICYSFSADDTLC